MIGKKLKQIVQKHFMEFSLPQSQQEFLHLDEELPIRRFPQEWDQYEEDCLLFLHFGRQRLSYYLQQILSSNDLDEANFYGRYECLLRKWSIKILASVHPIERLFKENPRAKTQGLVAYLREWKNYLKAQVLSLPLEFYMIKVLLVGKMARYRPNPAPFVPFD